MDGLAKDGFCDSSRSVEKLKGGGGKLHFSPTPVAAWFFNVRKKTRNYILANK